MEPKTVLIIDDHPETQDQLREIFQAHGFEVLVEERSPVAQQRLEEMPPPTLIIVELMLPGKDGMELCRWVRQQERLAGTKVVVITAKPYEFDRKRALSFGADGYLTKPLDAQTLMPTVERLLSDRMELTFWGCRGTLPVPGPHTVIYGGNTNCVTLEFAKGHFFIFDAGTGIKSLSDHLLRRGHFPMEGKVLISHPHWDHINALPFFVPLYMPGNEFEIMGATHGDVTMRELISGQMDGVYFPIKLKDFSARVYFRDLVEGSYPLYDGITLRTMLLSHPGNCLGFRVEHRDRSVCYITDNELYPRESASYNASYRRKLTRFVEGTDALILDATYTDQEYPRKEDWGHSNISEAVDLAHSARVKTLFLFHHDPDQGDADIAGKERDAQAMLDALGSTTRCLAPREKQRFSI